LNIDFDSKSSIFLQIADSIEDAILLGAYPEETQIPSTTDISVKYKINPATALKGINILVDDGIIYKKRGLGMFVAEGAVAKLKDKRKKEFFDSYVSGLIDEAKRLDIKKNEILSMIERGMRDE
jgi:Predicted transcriptional regulators